jgi:hypothetical protein
MQSYYLTISCFCKKRSRVVLYMYMRMWVINVYLTKWRRGLCGKIGSSHTGPETIFEYSRMLGRNVPHGPWNIPIFEYFRMLGRNVPHGPWNIPIFEYSRMSGRHVLTRGLKYSDIWIFSHIKKECSHKGPKIFRYLNISAWQEGMFPQRPWLANISANFRKNLKRS